jgi:hypothetical protein
MSCVQCIAPPFVSYWCTRCWTPAVSSVKNFESVKSNTQTTAGTSCDDAKWNHCDKTCWRVHWRYLVNPIQMWAVIYFSDDGTQIQQIHTKKKRNNIEKSHKHLFAKSKKSCHAWSFFADFCAILARSTHVMVISCVSNTLSPSGFVFAAFLGGGSAPRPMTCSATLGRAFSLDGPFLARLICRTSFTCCCYISACSVVPLFCVWLLPCPFRTTYQG